MSTPSTNFHQAVAMLAALAGIVGALLLAIPSMPPAWGFMAFLVSNIGWLTFSARHRHWSLFAQQCVFLLTSVVGLWNWWLWPLLKGLS